MLRKQVYLVHLRCVTLNVFSNLLLFSCFSPDT
uniref:Uncharacterized protein n=1 Tax=Arundo donax TaxID=35708 RepID=A0A0A9F3U0_ARUDO